MLTKEEKESLLKLARDTIGARLGKNKPADFSPGSSVLTEPRGAFVTLHKHGALKGCIGYVEAIKPLYQTVREMAVAAAFQDPRFESVTGDEFDQIEIEISVMSPIKKISNIDEIEVGKHGLIMKSGLNQGLLLPQVATEQGWDKETFLEHTCNKAGLYGDCWKKPETEISIFSAEVFSEK
ncbi:MAG TPA: AmmeMemoRadiSam system protein A [Spirochaetes bacterium]|nr:AmmeMemoRadiSam system protein A [Spirochaetota bacterium]